MNNGTAMWIIPWFSGVSQRFVGYAGFRTSSWCSDVFWGHGTATIGPLPEGLSVGKLVEHAKQPTRIIWILMVDMCSLFMGFTWFVGWVPYVFCASLDWIPKKVASPYFCFNHKLNVKCGLEPFFSTRVSTRVSTSIIFRGILCSQKIGIPSLIP